MTAANHPRKLLPAQMPHQSKQRRRCIDTLGQASLQDETELVCRRCTSRDGTSLLPMLWRRRDGMGAEMTWIQLMDSFQMHQALC